MIVLSKTTESGAGDMRHAHHGSAARPYACHTDARPPGAEWAIDYGFCRTSLDVLTGRTDPRCPTDCRHKAPAAVVTQFDKLFHWRGAEAAAGWARAQREALRK